MTAPRWAIAFLRRLAPPDRVDDVLGDLEEAHRVRVQQRGRIFGTMVTSLETLDMSLTLMRRRDPNRRTRTSWFSWLDFTLGFRMLIKYPGLSFVGVFAMAVGIAIGAGYFELLHDMMGANLPIEDGKRIVSLWNWNRATQSAEPQSVRDYVTWRHEMRSVDDIGAASQGPANLITEDGRVESVAGAVITASAFRMIRVPPLLGRLLVDADEQPGAPQVAVIGYDLWQRLAADPQVIGRTVRLGAATATVVGVMPEGFAFPVRNNVWTPLQISAADLAQEEGRRLVVFGRLAKGATLDEAEAELRLLVARATTDSRDSTRHLLAQVQPYAASFFMRDNGPDGSMVVLFGIQSMLLVVLVVACINVATLVFARTAARESELTIRTALGASRGRLVSQLFVEALVLAMAAAAVGLVIADRATRWGLNIITTGEGMLPFWWKERLSLTTLLFTGMLVVIAAVITGVLPALRATGLSLRTRLQDLSARGVGVRFGTWSTVLIVIQVAASVGLLTYALQNGWGFAQPLLAANTIAGDEFLSARLLLDRSTSSAALSEAEGVRYEQLTAELRRRVVVEPGIAGVTFADALPGGDHARRVFEVDGVSSGVVPGDRASVRAARVAPGFFDVLRKPVLAGREFTSGDAESERPVVIVNEAFVAEYLGGQSAIGRSVRFYDDDKPGPWHEVVGVVENLWVNQENPDAPGLYSPANARNTYPLHVLIRAPDDASVLGPRLGRIIASVDPTVRADRVLRLDEIIGMARRASMFFVFAVALVTGMVLLLATAGTYSLMSFIVSRRTREIGIRKALGATTRGVLSAVFARALAQLGIGVVLGMIPIVVWWDDTTPILLAALPVVLFLAGAVACAVPVARALRIEPTEALREA